MRVICLRILGILERYVVVPCQKEEMEKMRKGFWTTTRATLEQLAPLFEVPSLSNLDHGLLENDSSPKRAACLSWGRRVEELPREGRGGEGEVGL